MKIEFTDSAIQDLEDIKLFYKEQQVPQVGEKFIVEIIAHIETLTNHPEIGRIVPEFQASHIRELIHQPFRIVYTLSESAIHIVRVWRSERLLILD